MILVWLQSSEERDTENIFLYELTINICIVKNYDFYTTVSSYIDYDFFQLYHKKKQDTKFVSLTVASKPQINFEKINT
jgi:hypothetical protein